MAGFDLFIVPPDNTPIEGKDLYILGEFTGYKFNDASRMTFNPSSGAYEGSALLKMGFYNYAYVTITVVIHMRHHLLI